MITSMNTGVNAFAELDRLPLERVVEVHLSGLNRQSGVVWDDHAVPAPAEMFDLLKRRHGTSSATRLTMEYNWSALPQRILLSHCKRVRGIVGHQ